MADLWGLVWGKPEVGPEALAAAVETAAGAAPDYRTRLLIHDAADALEAHWGAERFARWLGRSGARERIEAIRATDFGEVGFPSLKERLMEPTRPETVRQFLRELGTNLARPTRLAVGGSVALILPGHLVRATEDIDVVDEVPVEVRNERGLLERLRLAYGLRLTHFQSHYLPAGWEARAHTLEPFGKLQVALVDALDVFLSKLFSRRDKDRDDLRLLLPGLEREAVVRRLRETCGGLLAEEGLREAAAHNWYVLTGEALPVA
jgi:hypothetical protein